MKKQSCVKPSQILAFAAAVLLTGMIFVAGSLADGPTKAADVSEARVLAEASEGDNWMVDGGDLASGISAL